MSNMLKLEFLEFHCLQISGLFPAQHDSDWSDLRKYGIDVKYSALA